MSEETLKKKGIKVSALFFYWFESFGVKHSRNEILPMVNGGFQTGRLTIEKEEEGGLRTKEEEEAKETLAISQLVKRSRFALTN